MHFVDTRLQTIIGLPLHVVEAAVSDWFARAFCLWWYDPSYSTISCRFVDDRDRLGEGVYFLGRLAVTMRAARFWRVCLAGIAARWPLAWSVVDRQARTT
jgi:hypothetical protein